jgi:hypothetical protein
MERERGKVGERRREARLFVQIESWSIHGVSCYQALLYWQSKSSSIASHRMDGCIQAVVGGMDGSSDVMEETAQDSRKRDIGD